MIQFRRLAAMLLGGWLAGSLFMDVTAVENFRAVDRFLAGPGIESALLIHGAGNETVKTLLRRAAGEANGDLFESWEWIQLGLGLGMLGVLVFGARPPKIPIGICLLMLALVLVERFGLTPNIVRLGRIVDFLPANPKDPQRVEFTLYHTAYAAVDLVKLLAGLAMAGMLVIRRAPDPEMFAREAELAERAMPKSQAKR